jgi:hypothetical protein
MWIFNMRFFIVVVVFLLVVVAGGADHFYADGGGAGKFVRVGTKRSDIYLQVSHIVSIRKSDGPGTEGETEIATMSGSYFTDEKMEMVMSRIIEK